MKVLFIDRDGTLIKEPASDFQVDSFEKLEFLPNVITNLVKIKKEFDFELVMVTNQDGLGTKSFPENTFWPVHNKMLSIFESEGITFKDILIDRSFEEENLNTRKPNTGLLTKYIDSNYDLKNSYVIGDRLTDIKLAKNLKSKSIFISNDKDTEHSADFLASNWDEIYNFLILDSRKTQIIRVTNETSIAVELDLNGGASKINTGLKFFDHMLEQIAKHSGHKINIKANGDLEVDEHHTIEDTALSLGSAYYKALTYKSGLTRYGFCLPMDDALALVAIDFSGRNWIEWNVEFSREKIGDMPTEMFYHFFKSFTDTAKCTLHIDARGVNEHHKIEAIFKCFAKALKDASSLDSKSKLFPSTKGVL